MSRAALAVTFAGFALGLVIGACDDQEPYVLDCSGEPDLSLFEQRIAPLMADGARSACNECHLAGVDLGLYSKNGDECTTMACMVEVGIVDLESPIDSKVLEWILRADPASGLITEDVLRAEHDGMLQWIEEHACGNIECPDVGPDPCGTKAAEGSCEAPAAHEGPPRGWTDPGDCSDVTIERGFNELIYSWRGRCYPCHFTSKPGPPEEAPRWIVDGECNAASLATMHNVEELGLIDRAHPDQSLLLLKPLAANGIEHGGGEKFADTNEGAYIDFLMWIEKYVACTAE